MSHKWLRKLLLSGLSLCLLTAGLPGTAHAQESNSPPPTAEDKNIFGEKTVVYGNEDAGYLQIPLRFVPVEGQSKDEQAYRFRDEASGQEIVWGIRNVKAPTDDKIPQDFKDLSPVYWIGFLNLRERIGEGGSNNMGEFATVNNLTFYHVATTLPDRSESTFYYLRLNNKEDVILLTITGPDRAALDKLAPIMFTWSPTKYE